MKQYILERIVVDENTGCWVWQLSKDRDGYGEAGSRKLRKQYGTHRAHRLSYILFKGHIDSDRLVCHTCNNRACVNPEHLYSGSAQDNSNDMTRAGRAASNHGIKHGASKLTDDDVRNIQRLCDEGNLSQREIGEKYGITQSHVSRLKHGVRWTHIK